MFSVIIPCYNRLDLLSYVLAGFCRQHNAPEFEILLIDNNSTADISQLCRHYDFDLELKVLRLPKSAGSYALCRARNLGLQQAQYSRIVTLDSDCVPGDSYLAALGRLYNQCSELFIGTRVFCDVTRQNVGAFRRREIGQENWPRVRSLSNYYRLVDRRLPQMARISKDHPHPWTYAHGGNCSYRRGDAMRIGGYDETYDGCWGYEDIDFAYRLVQQIRATIVYDSNLVTYHVELKQDEPDSQRKLEMMEKTANRNWKLITERIPGFREFKTSQYANISSEISV